MNFTELLEYFSIPDEAMDKFYELVEETEKLLDIPEKDMIPVRFLDRNAQLIFEIENIIKDGTKIIDDRKDSYMELAGIVPAEQVYLDLLLKVAEAPTKIHIMACIKNLIPIIADKLRERAENDETGKSNC